MFSLRIITIFYHLRTIRVNQHNRIALQVVDFYHSAYKRLYMPFRGIKWSSLFWQKRKDLRFLESLYLGRGDRI